MSKVFETISTYRDYIFGKYECGFYAVEQSNKSIGMTLIFTENYQEAKDYFDRIKLGAKAFWGGKGNEIITENFPNGCTLKESIDYFLEHGEELQCLGLI